MQQSHPLIISLFIALVALSTTPAVKAESLKTLIMPGPVIKAHEKYEQDCDQCHDTSSKKKQGKLCVKCHDHENIANDLADSTGFHGRVPDSIRNNCKHCHSEHKGRDANIVLLNPSTFDHDKTDFLLKGLHKTTTCKACHEPDEKYSAAPHDCYSCHKKDDIHDGEQGKKCGDCHKASGWKQNAFDHSETDFPLKHAHKETSCASCHINQKYKDTPKECISCHQIQDVHRGGFGKKCETCHNEKEWEFISFDHDRETDFALLGKHKKAACNSCHDENDIKKELPDTCHGCHKNDDSHKGRYGKKCKDCHTSQSWQKHKFDHDKETDFSLHGKHRKTSCDLCHKGDMYEDKLETTCISCHKQDDIHKGEQGSKCNNCHNERGWAEEVLFDHDITSFPLIGMHAITPCEECHLSTEYSKTDSECNACHADDDEHKTRLGTDCETCHNPNSWNTWLFDHDKDTDFEIDGAHKELGCFDCHNRRTNGPIEASGECISCHRSQDVHGRMFGRRCDDCHKTSSFTDVNIKR